MDEIARTQEKMSSPLRLRNVERSAALMASTGPMSAASRDNFVVALESCFMGETGPDWDFEKFHDYVTRHAVNVGIYGRPALARATGLGEAQLSRWYRGIDQPAFSSLQKLARVIGAPIAELLVLAGRDPHGQFDIAAAPEPPALNIHPVARELSDMLSCDSPIPEVDRAALETLIDRAINPYRRQMRSRRRGA
jgi:transcriptional regulator with XRE-family HTH domain